MESEEGRRLHGLAAQARERGESLEALKLNDEALIAYQKDKDYLGFSECLVDRSISFRHLAGGTEDDCFLIVAEHEALAAVEVARKKGSKEALAIPLARLGTVQEELGKFQEAKKTYQEAVDNLINNPPERHNRAAVVADAKIHLETCSYKAGDKTALERAEEAIKELEAAEEVSYNKNVWLSGAHMRVAEMLREDNPEKAKEHLAKAKEIIDSDERLKLRLNQWQKLAESFK